MKKSVYMLFISILAVACTAKREQSVVNEVIDATEICHDALHTSEFIDSSYFIPLETSDQCLIKFIDKVVFTSDYIFVLDRQGNNKVLVFNKNGRFLHTIGAIGHGPNEHVLLYDFCVDTATRQAYLLCERNVVKCYTYGGTFLAKKDLGFYSWKIERFDGYFYFIADDRQMPFDLVITDTAMQIAYKFFPFKEVGENSMILPIPIQKTPSGIQYFRYLDDHIYIVKGDSVSAQYAVDFGKTKINFQKLKDYTNEECRAKSKEIRGDIVYFIQNSDYAISLYYDKGTPMINVYNKKLHTSGNYYNFYDKYMGDKVLFAYVTERDEIVAIGEIGELQRNLAATKDAEVKKAIESLGLTEDSNPVLYIARTKQPSTAKVQ